jgi:Heterokaryon incompatibility protein (HET)
MTTRATIAELTKGVTLERLPQTIVDAVQITRRLGFKYLWIDALCIIQDDAGDKATEISKMGSIYKNATITVAAANARGATEGFLRAKIEKISTPSATVPFYAPESAEMGTVTLNSAVDSYSLSPEDHLSDRGWTLQEALLPPRLLVFSDIEVLWECDADHSGHENPKSANSGTVQRLGHVPTLRLQTRVYKDRSPDDLIGREELLFIWRKLIEDFTSRNLTDPEDRLPGVQGVAMEVMRALKEPCLYVAGVWGSCLPELLLWRQKKRDKAASQVLAKSDRAPTWSWASTDWPVSFFDQIDGIQATAEFLNDRPDILRKFNIEADHERSAAIVIEGQAFTLDRNGDNIRPASGPNFLGDNVVSLNVNDTGTLSIYADVEIVDLYGPTTVFMTICRYDRIVVRSRQGIAIQPVGDGTYRRVAYFSRTIKSSISESVVDFGSKKTLVII